MAGSVSLSIWAALGNGAAITVSLAQLGLFIFAAKQTALQITVTKGWLLVGPAAIERAFIHNFRALGATEFKRIRGVDADPASYLQIRFWVSDGIKIDLRDPKDKTPYWLISTNRANELAKLLDVPEN